MMINNAYKIIIIHKFSSLTSLKTQSKFHRYIYVEFYDENNMRDRLLTKEKTINYYENKTIEDEHYNNCNISLNSHTYAYESLHTAIIQSKDEAIIIDIVIYKCTIPLVRTRQKHYYHVIKTETTKFPQNYNIKVTIFNL